MLNRALKNNSLERYRQVVRQHEIKVAEVHQDAGSLHELRQKSAQEVISACEAYVNTLANTPKEFEKSVSEFKVEYDRFTQLLADIEWEDTANELVGGSVVGAGAAIGVGVAAFAPTAAMAVATTFGVASTGTAISSLAGAAASKAALAWLGGGALAAGGAGMAGGSALLALAGPVGWSIGAVGLVAGVTKMRRTNSQIAEKATREAVKVEAGIALLTTARTEIQRLLGLTSDHAEGVSVYLNRLKDSAPRDYLAFSNDEKFALGSLINNVNSLARLLNKKVE